MYRQINTNSVMCKNQLPCHLHGSGDRTRNWEPGCQSVFGFIWLIYKESYPSLHSVTVVIPWPKTPEEEKNTSGFLSIVHRGGNSGQEFKQELRAETRQEHRLLVGLLLLLTQPAFLYYPGPPPRVIPHQSPIKKMHFRLASSYGGIFSWGSPSQTTLACIRST